MRSRGRAPAVNLLRPQERLENLFQRAASAKDAGLHRAYAAFENFGDFFITESFEVAQNHGAAKNIGNLLQSAVNGRLNFQRGEQLERRGAEILDFDA